MERLDKFLTEAGAGTRSQVKQILKSGRVAVDGKPVKDETACNARRIRKFFEKDSEVFVCGEGALSNCFQKG